MTTNIETLIDIDHVSSEAVIDQGDMEKENERYKIVNFCIWIYKQICLVIFIISLKIIGCVYF